MILGGKNVPGGRDLAVEAGAGVPESVVGLERCGQVGKDIGYGVDKSGNTEVVGILGADAPADVQDGRDPAVEVEIGTPESVPASLKRTVSASDIKACTAGDSDEFRGERSDPL